MDSPQIGTSRRSRYGRTLRPKLSPDFRPIDTVQIDEVATPTRPSRRRTNLSTSRSPSLLKDLNAEFAPLDDLSMKVANSIKSKVQRSSDTSIKERKFFKSTSENKLNHANVIDVNQVFKLISPKSPPVVEKQELSSSAKILKTYGNKCRPAIKTELPIESFGLPDEPIFPINNVALHSTPRNRNIDLPDSSTSFCTEVIDINKLIEQNYTWSTKLNEEIDMNFNTNMQSCGSPRRNQSLIAVQNDTPTGSLVKNISQVRSKLAPEKDSKAATQAQMAAIKASKFSGTQPMPNGVDSNKVVLKQEIEESPSRIDESIASSSRRTRSSVKGYGYLDISQDSLGGLNHFSPKHDHSINTSDLNHSSSSAIDINEDQEKSIKQTRNSTRKHNMELNNSMDNLTESTELQKVDPVVISVKTEMEINDISEGNSDRKEMDLQVRILPKLNGSLTERFRAKTRSLMRRGIQENEADKSTNALVDASSSEILTDDSREKYETQTSREDSDATAIEGFENPELLKAGKRKRDRKRKGRLDIANEKNDEDKSGSVKELLEEETVVGFNNAKTVRANADRNRRLTRSSGKNQNRGIEKFDLPAAAKPTANVETKKLPEELIDTHLVHSSILRRGRKSKRINGKLAKTRSAVRRKGDATQTENYLIENVSVDQKMDVKSTDDIEVTGITDDTNPPRTTRSSTRKSGKSLSSVTKPVTTTDPISLLPNLSIVEAPLKTDQIDEILDSVSMESSEIAVNQRELRLTRRSAKHIANGGLLTNLPVINPVENSCILDKLLKTSEQSLESEQPALPEGSQALGESFVKGSNLIKSEVNEDIPNQIEHIIPKTEFATETTPPCNTPQPTLQLDSFSNYVPSPVIKSTRFTINFEETEFSYPTLEQKDSMTVAPVKDESIELPESNDAHLLSVVPRKDLDMSSMSDQSDMMIDVKKHIPAEFARPSTDGATGGSYFKSQLIVVLSPLQENNYSAQALLEVEVKRERSDKRRRRSSKLVRSEDLELAFDDVRHAVGDLTWGRFNTYQYWPCMITEHPQLKTHTIQKARHAWPVYHVRFFGDNGRSAWIPHRNLIPFHSRNDLDIIANQLISKKNISKTAIKKMFWPKRSRASWLQAIDEAVSLLNQSVDARLPFFELQQQQQATKPKVEPKVEKTSRKRKNSLEDHKFVPDKVIKTENNTTEMEEIEPRTLRERKSLDDSIDEEEQFGKELLRNAIEENASKTSRRKQRSYINPVSMFASSAKAIAEDVKDPSLVSLSKTSSKTSDFATKFPTSLDEQIALVKRNNIFRGISREKVCLVCLRAGNVEKCEGVCGEFYHRACVLVLKREAIEKAVEMQVEIITVRTAVPMPHLTSSPSLEGKTLEEKIDLKLGEVMKDQLLVGYVLDESLDSSCDELSFAAASTDVVTEETKRPVGKKMPALRHVTADSALCEEDEEDARWNDDVVDAVEEDLGQAFKCSQCVSKEVPCCLVCNARTSPKGTEIIRKCSLQRCHSHYHLDCLATWPQTDWSVSSESRHVDSDSFACPRHVCHTCISDDPRAAFSRSTSDKIVRCLRCPATYHTSTQCIPAGTAILSMSQVVCPRHSAAPEEAIQPRTKRRRSGAPKTINANWCFICAKGGALICCETCPASVHLACLPMAFDEREQYYCEDCQSGRLPLYDEVVWVKMGVFRWWPAIVLFPAEVPENVRHFEHDHGEFVVKFFGTHDHYWVGRGRTFLFQEDDTDQGTRYKGKRVDRAFKMAVDEAVMLYNLKREFKTATEQQKRSSQKPPPYKKIKVNRPVGNVRQTDGNLSNSINPCICDPKSAHPCGPDSNCLNRLLLTECDPELCPAGDRCNNQRFEKREYPPLVPCRTSGRGWGLKTLAPIDKGQFVIEYVGEVIDDAEYRRRIERMHLDKKDDFYFLTIDNQRTIDAGPKGNVARFMNHSCAPNCETQKWTVGGDTRVGIFAKEDIDANTELTFNYNLECIGEQKKVCMCGAKNCAGFIGVKVRQEEPRKKVEKQPINNKQTKEKSKKKLRRFPPPLREDGKDLCFVCRKPGNLGGCNHRFCNNQYHLKCVSLKQWPKDQSWTCSWHYCNVCSKLTAKKCMDCLNSYCSRHMKSFLRLQEDVGYICVEHDSSSQRTTILPNKSK